jgi:hypothetical protein
VALFMHQNSWYDMFAVGLQMALDMGWVHRVKELFPLSNISSYHIFMSCEWNSTDMGTSAEYGGMSKHLAWVKRNHTTKIQTRYTSKHNTTSTTLCYVFQFIRTNIHSFHWHMQYATIPCRSQELLPFLSVIHFFLPFFSTNYSSILHPFILPSVSWSTSWSCRFQSHIQYSFGNSIFFHH